MKDILIDIGLSDSLAAVLGNVIGVVLLATVFLLVPIITIWIERKAAARFQNRLGPNRVGPFGLLQSLADVVKLLTKELILPKNVDLIPYMLAPILMVVSVILIVAVIPVTPTIIGSDLSIGALYFVAVSSLATIAVVMAGWGSNNKYALLGAFRTVAQLVSYEIPLVFSLLIPVMLVGTMSMQGITEFQGTSWLIIYAPTAALIFLISNIAEIGRAPFDLIEAESELIAGYMIEYSAMGFAMFMLGEFLHAFLVAVLFSVLFLGGWQGPFVESVPILGVVYLSAKTMLVYFAMLWIRVTVPRFRIDHLLAFNWKFLIPLSIAHLLLTGFLWKVVPDPQASGNVIARFIDEIPRMVIMGGSSLGLGIVSLIFLRNYTVQEREQFSELVSGQEYPLATTAQGAQSNVIVVSGGD